MTLVVRVTAQQAVTNTATVGAAFASDPMLDNNISQAMVTVLVDGELPRAGTDLTTMIAVAVTLILGGVLAVAATRRT